MIEEKMINPTEKNSVDKQIPPSYPEKKLTDKKKKIIYIIIIFFTLVMIVWDAMNEHNKKSKTDIDKIAEYIETIGKRFYENYYYPQLNHLIENKIIDDIPTFLTNFKEVGIPVSLNQIIELHVETEQSLKKTIGKYQCDYDETRFIIYPESPYKKNTYKIKTSVSCK